jgi:transcriptional regulator with XRE-family HTH domain
MSDLSLTGFSLSDIAGPFNLTQETFRDIAAMLIGMPNHRLRNALIASETSQAQLAEAVDVDPKSVERWITQDRLPHPTTRAKVAKLLRFDETYFWPTLLDSENSRAASQAELVQLWPSRNAVPEEIWRSLFAQADEQIDILVYSGGFLIEAYGLVEIIERKSAEGVSFRILLGDPRCEQVRIRGEDEGLSTMPERCRSTAEYLATVAALPDVDIRLHQTVLYASQYRFDDSALINNHTYGEWAAQSPVLHLINVPGGHLFEYYNNAFERVWDTGHSIN